MGLPAAMAASFRRISSESVDKILVNWEAMKLVRKLRNMATNAALCTWKGSLPHGGKRLLKYFQCDDLFDVLICGDGCSRTQTLGDANLKSNGSFGADRRVPS